MKTKLFFLTILGFVIACCKEDSPPPVGLPAETHSGKNTFGCYIDGVPFVAEIKFTVGGAVPVSGSFDETSKLFQIQGSRENESKVLDDIRFRAYVVNDLGTYEMSVTSSVYMGYTDYSGPECQYFHDISNKGAVTIKYLNTEKDIIAGTFAMTLINSDCSDSTMVITEGRFDFAY